MKKSIIHSIWFCLLFSFLSFVIGGVIGAQIVPKGSGLAGPAEVVMYAFLGLLIGLIVSIYLVRNLSSRNVRKSNLLMSIIAAACFLWLFIRMKSNNPKLNESIERKETKLGNMGFTKVDNSHEFPSDYSLNRKQAIGMGMVKPRMAQNERLYFYDIDLNIPIDSVVFTEEHYNIGIKTAPPWFVPETMKLDYQILFLKAISLRSQWIQVVVNKMNGQLAWVDRASVEYVSWEDFFLSVHSVESIDPILNPIRTKANAQSSKVNFDQDVILSPYEVKNEWLKVKVYSEDYNELGSGWLRWKKDGQIVVNYSLLS